MQTSKFDTGIGLSHYFIADDTGSRSPLCRLCSGTVV